MPIENNLPTIFDTATETEDGLMSYQDKIKINKLDESLNSKVGKDDKIKSSQLDTSTDSSKIQPTNLSDAVKKMMTGASSVEATVPNNGVTTEKLATNAITIDKIDKRVLLGNIVSPRPLNFAFDTKKVSITIPQGSLFLTDAITKRILVTGSDTKTVTVNINYPTAFTGLNYIVSTPSGSLSMINHTKLSTITNVNSIMALVSLSSAFEATIVMNGNYTINGLAQGIGTESAALLSTGKIVFDKLTGIVDFTQATQIHLIIGGMFNRTIATQASLRLVDYATDSIYILYWDNATSSLKTALATVTNTDTDINKIAMIKDGRIIPFVDTGIFFSKPKIESPYYTETFEDINNIGISSNVPIDIITKTERKIKFDTETIVYLNQQNLVVKNKECYYEDREGMHYILFDLDTQTISCRHYKQAVDTTKKNIVVGSMWISKTKFPEVTGNITYTVDGKTVYQDDLNDAMTSIKELQDITKPELITNRVLTGTDLYMIEGEDTNIYSSSMMVKESEGSKTILTYKNTAANSTPKSVFINGSESLEPAKISTSTATVSIVDKYNSKGSYLTKNINIKKAASTAKKGHKLKILCLGDDLINDKTAYHVKNKLTSLGAIPTMLGTMVNSQVYGEGRNGWFYSTFVGASGRGQQEGKITPQTSKGSSSILLNPFIRTANADDKANYPNDCYRATGAYVEKSYYSDTDKTGAFYIFDFARYLELQGIDTPDVVVIALKPELSNVYTTDIVSTNIKYLKQLVNGIRKALPNTQIVMIPQYGSSTVYPTIWESTYKMIEETEAYVKTLNNPKTKLLSSWVHMCRETGFIGYTLNTKNDQLYEDISNKPLSTKLSENAKIELANSITAFILNN